MHPTVSASAVLIGAIVIATIQARRRLRKRNFPPGPPPTHWYPWLTFTEWRAVYGDLVYTKMFGQDMVVVNSEKVADDLMEKRSRNYSDRLDMSNMLEPYGLDYDTALIPHDDTRRGIRHVLQQTLRPEAILVYKSTQLRCVGDLLRNLSNTPASWWKHLRTVSAVVILGVVYEHELPTDPDSDLTFRAVVEGCDIGLAVTSTGPTALITAFPTLKYVPMWIPGGRWFNAANCKGIPDVMISAPFDKLLRKIAAGESGQSAVADALTKFQDTTKVDNIERVVRDSCGTAFAANTGSTLIVFALAMVLHPSVQKRAQEEIGPAIYRETLRWKSVAPLAIPHAATTRNKDIYDGYRIPNRTVILPNLWAMSRDSTKYPSPDTFAPERFLDANGNVTGETPNFAFGFASGSVWIAIARILGTFSIEKARDASGNVVEPNPEWTKGFSREYPKPFPCNFVPRWL
ncbi:cytochrome P450 [Coniophora puteana RWD-64-598 SS2]|uniref:Cytochrome P450 n=1 Tax=Coniophora puteana (strain RWD-64-598) TaxID=741705 RepID=A0A5M3N3J5_CONPW|nr:cytochrome P450 [Coniophora puteana RWD-64-598 SS2]EIW85877.1 cytochrome P450 [Coniophora puteana RWD-64-598 SS2]